jgi:magnesium chelatase family protein
MLDKSLARLWSSTLVGLDSVPVRIEIDVSTGLPGFHVVGLPDAAVSESCDRVRTALRNTGYLMPPRRVTINLAPGDLRKQGPRFDLAIALGILGVAHVVPLDELEKSLIVGELGLDGQVRAVSGILAATLQAKAQGLSRVIVPLGCVGQARLVEGIEVLGVVSLEQTVRILQDPNDPGLSDVDDSLVFSEAQGYQSGAQTGFQLSGSCSPYLDLHSLIGQPMARRALEIVAAGAHHLLLVGPPGCGKTHLARCLPGLLPTLKRDAALEVLRIRSILEANSQHNWSSLPEVPPFQEPDVAATWAGLYGSELPGEISRAHQGVLFMDEFLEYKRPCLETLRTVLDTRRIEIVRARKRLVYPADFTLVAAMNPCPCGYYGDKERRCSCSASRRQAYLARLSGPLKDRIDLHLWLNRPKLREWFQDSEREDSRTVRERVQRCRDIQSARGCYNAQMQGPELETHCRLGRSDEELLLQAASQFALSGRSIHKILRLARTIADLEQQECIGHTHLMEALGFRDPQELRAA